MVWRPQWGKPHCGFSLIACLEKPVRFGGMWRKWIGILTVSSLAGMVLLYLNPVHDTIHRLAFLGSILGFWAGCLLFFWKRVPIRYALLLMPIFPAMAFALPDKEISQSELRKDYLENMKRLQGVPYFWGGENFKGIDCSGLPRKSLRQALFHQGMEHGNGRAFRMFAEQWWYDSSAKALSMGYRRYAVPLNVTGTIRTLDYSMLKPGDLGITEGGVHVMIYMGGDEWIQADPGKGRVAISNGRTENNTWFDVPVAAYRWTVLN